MVKTKLNVRLDVVHAETLSSAFATSTTLSGASATIPANTGEVICFPSAACHWNPVGAATSSFTHAVAANEPFVIPNNHIATAQIFGDAGAMVLTVVYMRGAGRQDTSYTAQARPN